MLGWGFDTILLPKGSEDEVICKSYLTKKWQRLQISKQYYQTPNLIYENCIRSEL